MANRELYLEILDLIERQRTSERSLEDYLLALLAIASEFRQLDRLECAAFLQVLEASFTAGGSEFDQEWRIAPPHEELPSYAGWRAVLVRQLVDLREMAEAG